ncbi:MAG: SDR family oxidoreductase [Oscillochloris sp.]|nr:SDR family oxidoreductase [Oscillochloris sp.]
MTDQPVLLVTGARKGIGRFLAEYYLARGWLVEGCSREPSDLANPGYAHHCLDVSDENAVRTMVREIGRRHKRLDALINNAGVAAMNHALLTPASVVERTLAVNVLGSFLVTREAARLMQRRRFGRIVNMGTVAVPLQLEGEAAYAASKAAVVSLTQVLARELAPFGITVNLVGPSPIETDLIRGVPADKIAAIIERLAVKRLGRPEDVANVIDFFISPASDYVTGQVIYLGGA